MKQTSRIAFIVFVAWASAVAAEATDTDPWEACRQAPVRSCLLAEAVDLLSLLDRTSRRSAVLAFIVEARAGAGDVTAAVRLARGIPAGEAARIDALRAIAEAQARAGHGGEAADSFDQALQLAYALTDALPRAQALHAIARVQATSGFAAAAGETDDQALQAAQTVRIGQPQMLAARLIKEIALHQAATGELAKATETARSVRYDPATRVSTFLALADLALGAGGLMDTAALLGEARGAARGEVALLCAVARAQARAGLAAEARATLVEATQDVRRLTGTKPFSRDWSATLMLAEIADAEREAGLSDVAQATLAQAAALADAVPESDRPTVREKVAEAQLRAGLVAAAASSMALARDEAGALADSALRVQVLARFAARTGHNNEAASLFAEALAAARAAGERRRDLLMSIADAQDEAGLVADAGTTYGEALAGPPRGRAQAGPGGDMTVIHRILDGDRGRRVVAASPELRVKLVDAAQEVTDRLTRAELLCAIARALPE